jgi:DDE superfamily endonuclease/Helix-turn-helix of DDE superfamily endonuclease
MINYNELKNKPKDFLAATGLKIEEFEKLKGGFKEAYKKVYPEEKNKEGNIRKRREGAGVKGQLEKEEDKLLFILIYEKTNQLQTMQALQFEMSQPQANYWIHHLMAVLKQILKDQGLSPEREAEKVVKSEMLKEGILEMAIDATERKIQRPKDEQKQKDYYSGKKKTHTEKNIVLIDETTSKVIYLSPSIPGKTHDKKAVDELSISYPQNASLDKDTGFQGYEPDDILNRQPKKSRKEKT